MNKNVFAPVFALLCALVFFTGNAVAGPSSKSTLLPMADGTLEITREASNGFNRDIAALKAAAREDAEKYCAAQNKQLKVISETSSKPFFGTGYAKAKIVFRALNPGEIDVHDSAGGGVSPSVTASTDEIYAALTKLDDLRKKGILTDEEFQAEKKKVLSHSR